MTRAPATHASRSAYVLIALLTASIFINYIDRSNLSVAAPVLQAQLGYTTRQIGLLSSAFFWTYAGFQLIGISGWISDRFAVAHVLAFGFLAWSLATAASGLTRSFSAFFLMRLVLGVGESLAYPCYARLIAIEVPQQMRGRANALLDAGSKLGPGLGTFLGGVLLERYSWRWFFVVLGVAGLLWLGPWLLWSPRSAAVKRELAGDLPSAVQMFRERSAWGTFGGHFCGNYFWFFLLIWLPSYFVHERGLDMHTMAWITGSAYFVVASGTLSAGWVSDWLLKRGRSVTRVRKSFVTAGLLGSTVVVATAFVADIRASVTLLYISCFCFGIYTSNHWVITQTLAGPAMAGRWTSVQNGIGNFSGIAAAWFTGVLVERTGSFRMAFLTSAAIAFAGAAFWSLAVGPVRETAWRRA